MMEEERNMKKEQETAGKTTKGKKTSSKKKDILKQDKKAEKLQERIKELEQETNASRDKYLRIYSEFDNYRKRTLREKIELSKTASEEVITDLLPVLDDFERAIKSMEEQEMPEIDGIRLIYNKLKNILGQKGLKSIEALGQPFDVDYHEAVTNIPAPSDDLKGKVVDVIEKGYLLSDKVIRYSKVVVGQ